jgi:hypothetical protein
LASVAGEHSSTVAKLIVRAGPTTSVGRVQQVRYSRTSLYSVDRRNNPAGRLFELLEAAFAAADDDNKMILDVWRAALHTNDNGLLFRQLGFIHDLPGEIRRHIEELDGENHEMLLRGLPGIETALDQPLHHPWVHFAPHVTDLVRFQLENAADALARQSFEPVAPKDDLAELHNEVRALFNEIANSGIDYDLKIALVRYVVAMDEAIAAVRIRGVAALQDVVEMTWGGEFIRDQMGERPDTEEGQRLRARVLKAAVTLGSFVSLTNGAIQLAGNTYDALPLGDRKTADQTTTVEDGDLPALIEVEAEAPLP